MSHALSLPHQACDERGIHADPAPLDAKPPISPLPPGKGRVRAKRSQGERLRFLVQNQRTLVAIVSPLFPPLIKGGQGGFTGKARHAQKGLLNMH
jgi:hypothetical protein